MSHTKRDAPGGHIDMGTADRGGIIGWSTHFRRYAKRRSKRELRRESRSITREAVAAFYDDVAQDEHEQALQDLEDYSEYENYLDLMEREAEERLLEEEDDYGSYEDYGSLYDPFDGSSDFDFFTPDIRS